MLGTKIGIIIDTTGLYERYRGDKKAVIEQIIRDWDESQTIPESSFVPMREWTGGYIEVALFMFRRHISVELADLCRAKLGLAA